MSPAVAVVLAAIPSPDRGVWYLGPIPIRAYALCIILGVVVAVAWGERRFVARGGQRGTVTDIAVYAVPFGLIGGRIYHVLTDWPTYFGPGGNPVDALKIWQGGLGIWGAIAFGALGAWIGCRRRGVPLPFFADAVAPGIIVAQAVGRLGNWFNQELYGGPTDLPWGLEIYRRVDPDTGIPDPIGGVALDATPIEIVHPTFLYELLWNLLVAALVVWADRRFRLGHGRAFAVYVAGYTLGRFFIEQMRVDPATQVFGDIRINTVVSVVVFLAAVAYLVLAPRGREVLTGPAAAEPDGGDGGDGDGSGDGAADREAVAGARSAAIRDGDGATRVAGAAATAAGVGTVVATDDRVTDDRATDDRATDDRATDSATATDQPDAATGPGSADHQTLSGPTTDEPTAAPIEPDPIASTIDPTPARADGAVDGAPDRRDIAAPPSSPTDRTPTGGQRTDAVPTSGNPNDGAPAASSPTGSNPTDSSPTGSSPTGSSPTGSSPTGSNPAGSNPTDANPTGGERADGERPGGDRTP